DGIRDWSVTGVQTCALPISDQRRKSEALKHKRNQDDAECQKDNHVSLGKWGPIGQGLRQGDGGGQRYYAPHSRPSNDEDVPSWRHGFYLVKKASSYDISQICPGEHPHQAQQYEKSAE